MRISSTDVYKTHQDCDIYDCNRNYCSRHRLLWRDCETMKETSIGDLDVMAGLSTVYEPGDCPKCEGDYRRRRFEYAHLDH